MIFAITIFGGLFGIPGMVIGVPVFAIIYAGFRSYFHRMLRKKGLPTDTSVYIALTMIKNKECIYTQEQQQDSASDKTPKSPKQEENNNSI